MGLWKKIKSKFSKKSKDTPKLQEIKEKAPKRYRRVKTKLNKLTDRQQNFVKAYTDPTSPGYLNKTQSAREAYNPSSTSSAANMGQNIMKKPHVNDAVREILNSSKIKDKIIRGVDKRLEDPMTHYWQPTADFWAKITGQFAPEKQIVAQVTPENRRKSYHEIAEFVREVEAGKDPVIPEKN